MFVYLFVVYCLLFHRLYLIVKCWYTRSVICVRAWGMAIYFSCPVPVQNIWQLN